MSLLVWNCLLDGLHASSFAKIAEFYKTQRFGTGSIYIYVCAYIYIHVYILLVFSPWASLGRNQSPFRRPVWLWYAASWEGS